MWIFGYKDYKVNSRKLYWHAHCFMKMLKIFIAFLDSYPLSDVAAEYSSQDIIRIHDLQSV